jgi:tripartite-type tricarboxylate transporter receptor subunit TctC
MAPGGSIVRANEERLPMPTRRHLMQLAGGTLLLAPSRGRAETWPTRPVRIIVVTGPGGQGDTIARLVAQKLTEALGRSFIVENIPGGGGNIAMGMAARAAPDGYTILAASGSLVTNPSLFAKIPFDPYTDFAPVTLLCSSTHALVVHPSVPARNLAELIALAKAEPGRLSYASAGRGTPANLAGELFKHAFGLDIVHVPFNGGGPAVTAVLGNHVPISVSAMPTAVAYVRSGTLRALAVTSAKRAAALPDLPTVGEAAGHDVEADIVTGFVVPAGTPQEIIALLHREVVRIMALADVRERLASLGYEAVANTPEEFARWIRAEIPKWAQVVRDAGMSPQ